MVVLFSRCSTYDLFLQHSCNVHLGGGARVQGKNEGAVTVKAGRLAMVAITVLGTIPVFMGPEILSATTVSGAMVAGLAPVFCLWNVKAPPLSFWLSVGFGLLCGFVLVFGWWPASWVVSTGKYAELLGVTIVEVVGCFVLYLLPLMFKRHIR
jgi:hypothetical protein